MKPCRKKRRSITWLVMDALDSKEAAELVTHLDRCEGCRAYRDEILTTKHRVNALRLLSPDSQPDAQRLVGARVIPSFSRPIEANSTRGRRSLGFGWIVAAAGGCVLVLALLVLSFLEHPRPVQRSSLYVTRPAPRVAPGDLLPSLANYRAIGNKSLDQLDQILTRQSQSSRTEIQPPTAGRLGLLNIED